jgi:aminomuconate-semialdehyde/2-hydroxymuconate-6-semialdehyde dehydrogenase
LDIPRAASNFRFFATAILHTESEAHVTDNVAFNYTLRQPRGIAGLISP